MASNVKARTEDVDEILDIKIKASSPHSQLNVLAGDDYDSVLTNIATRSPSLTEKQALDAALAPSAANPYMTFSAMTAEIDAKIPWVTIGPAGSGSDFEGSDETPFQAAFLGGGEWFQVREGTYTFTSTLAVPMNVRLVGASATATVLQGTLATPILTLDSNSYMAYLAVTQSGAGSAVGVIGDNVSVENVVATAPLGSNTFSATSVDDLKIFECASLTGEMFCSFVSDSFLHGMYFDAPTVDGLELSGCNNVSLTSSIFKNGVFHCAGSVSVRAVANHFNDGTNISLSTILLRANTPNVYNNEVDDFANLLSYIGSPSVLTVDPPFANNYAGPPGEDLTARASSLDLLLQWRYEERNFQLAAASEPTTLSWDPTTNSLSSTGAIRIYTSHRESYWEIAALGATNIPTNSALYVVLDRTLGSTPIVLTPVVAAVGSIPNDRDNRQVFVLAFATGTTLWWRGGNGTRFPGTGGQTGTYFVDGSSKSLLDFIGAVDYNDSDPNYSNNFAGVNGESLVVRTGKTDTLIKRLFEYSNLGIHLSDTGFVSVEPGPGTTYRVSLTGTMYFSFPHVAGRITATGPLTFDLDNTIPSPNQLVYFTLNQGGLAGVDIAITASTIVNEGLLPLPDAYPLTTKYFVFARRVGSSVFLWDDTELPVGGRYPQPLGRRVVPVAAAVALSDNTEWDGTNFLWESLKLAVSTGQSLDRNVFANQLVASPGLTDLAEGEGLVVTHTWNSGSTPQNVTIQKVAVPLVNMLNQNQFLWVQRRSGNIIFSN